MNMATMKQTALITGGSRGIGLGIAMELAKEGIDLAINGVRPEEQVTEVLDQLRAFGIRVIYCQGDISQKSGRESILEKIRKEMRTAQLPGEQCRRGPKGAKGYS